MSEPLHTDKVCAVCGGTGKVISEKAGELRCFHDGTIGYEGEHGRSVFALSAGVSCSKCGKTPPFPGGTRCQDLACPLVKWDTHSAIKGGK